MKESEEAWVPPGRSVEVKGFRIPEGMVYVGSRMSGSRWAGIPDPALIDPSLPIARGTPPAGGHNLPYWPSYSEIKPASRAGYLAWLANGRRDANAELGFVFLFFYGIERRLLHDANHLPAAGEEIPVLEKELRELLQVYGDSSSFRGYAARLLQFIEVTRKRLDTAMISPPLVREGWDLPIVLQLGLGAIIKAGEPLPAEWALSWLRCHPDTRLRTPAKRCPEEFDRLFQIRYTERFDEGMRIRPNKSRLTIVYQPASAGFSGNAELTGHDLPDANRLSAPLQRLREIADEVIDEIDGYSRWVGRTDDRDSPAAIARLPPGLASDKMNEQASAILSLVGEKMAGDGIALLPTLQLTALFPSTAEDKLTKKERFLLADFLARFGYGIEPDARYGGANISRHEQVAVFQLGQGDVPPREEFGAACVILHLGATVANADEQVTAEEERELDQQLGEIFELTEPDRDRLRAHLKWLLAEPPGMRGLKRKVEDLPEGLRRNLGRYLISIAGADGYVSPEELQTLSKLYPMLGLDASLVYRDVHAIAAAGSAGDVGPVTVLPADRAGDGFAIPDREVRGDETGLRLDPVKVAAIKEQTRAASHVLGEIFASDEDDFGEDEEESGIDTEQEGAVALMDDEHSALVRRLVARSEWTRADFESLAEEHGLMPSGAIETINDAAFEICGEPILEGDDPIEVNPYAAEEMFA